MASMLREWTLFLDRCIERRISADLFDAAAAQLHAKSPLPGRKIAELLLRPRAANTNSVDPRVIIFLERLLALKKVDASDVLNSAFQYSKDRLPKTGDDGTSKNTEWHNPPELEEVIFHRLSKAFQAEERPVRLDEGLGTLIGVTRWMQTMVTSHTSDTMIQAMAGIQQQPQQQSINVREGLGMLVVGVIENQKMLSILNNHRAKGRDPLTQEAFVLAECYVSPSARLQLLMTSQTYASSLRDPCPLSYLSYRTAQLVRRTRCRLPIGWRYPKSNMIFTTNLPLSTAKPTGTPGSRLLRCSSKGLWIFQPSIREPVSTSS
jgi:hypothetical protein